MSTEIEARVRRATRAELIDLARELARAGLDDHEIAAATDLHVNDVRAILAHARAANR